MSHSLGSEHDVDDPGADPKGLNPPRNPLASGGTTGAGSDQDTGQGDPKDSPGTEGPSDVPEPPTEDDDRA
jgi:hypothetical protein